MYSLKALARTTRQCRHTAVRHPANRRADTKKARLHALLSERAPEHIDEEILRELESALAPISRDYLRQLLRATGCPLAPAVRGISLHSPADLRTSLLAFAELYAAAED